MIKLYGQKVDRHVVHIAEQQIIYDQWEDNLKEGALTVSTHKIYRPRKTWNQVKNHFGNALMKIVREFDDNGWDVSILYRLEKPTGVPINFDMLQQFFYAMFPTYNDAGKLITMSHEDYTTEHCSKFFEDIRNYAASQWSIVIPNPDPNWKK